MFYPIKQGTTQLHKIPSLDSTKGLFDLLHCELAFLVSTLAHSKHCPAELKLRDIFDVLSFPALLFLFGLKRNAEQG